MPNPNDDVLYAMRFKLEAGDTPGEHLAAVRGTTNRTLVSKHIKQVVDTHNIAPENEHNKMTVLSLTQCTQEELDKMVSDLRQQPDRVDVSEVYPDEKDYNRSITTKVPETSEATEEAAN